MAAQQQQAEQLMTARAARAKHPITTFGLVVALPRQPMAFPQHAAESTSAQMALQLEAAVGLPVTPPQEGERQPPART